MHYHTTGESGTLYYRGECTTILQGRVEHYYRGECTTILQGRVHHYTTGESALPYYRGELYCTIGEGVHTTTTRESVTVLEECTTILQSTVQEILHHCTTGSTIQGRVHTTLLQGSVTMLQGSTPLYYRGECTTVLGGVYDYSTDLLWYRGDCTTMLQERVYHYTVRVYHYTTGESVCSSCYREECNIATGRVHI